MEVTKIKRHKYNKPKVKYQPTIGEELEVVEGDKVALTDPTENKRRRTLMLERKDGSWGFTLQSYGIHNREENQVEMLTYVDYVEFNGAANLAGMRAGDVILSINGTSVEDYDHPNLVNFIKSCGETMRMVVLFEDCCRKVALHLKYLKLKRVLAEKLFELRSLELQENRVLSGQTQFGSRRSSLASSSSAESHFDRLSLLPELDVFPRSAWSPLSDSDHVDGGDSASLQGSAATPPFIKRFEFDRCSLPVGYSGSVSSLGSNQSSPTSLTRDKRPVSMRLQYTHRSVTNMLDVQLPVPQRLNPELLRSSASLSSFGSLRSIEGGSSLYKHTLLSNCRGLRKTESMAGGVRYRDKSPEYQKALNTSTRSLKYTVSAPPSTMMELKPLEKGDGKFRPVSSPSRSDEALDKHDRVEKRDRLTYRRSSSTSSLVSAARRHARGSSPGISTPSPKPQLSPISYLIKDGDLYEIPCSSVDGEFPEFTDLTDDSVFTPHDDIEEETEGEPVEVKIYLSHPQESSTDHLSDIELHDVSLDSVEIYGFDSDSEGETIDAKEDTVKTGKEQSKEGAVSTNMDFSADDKTGAGNLKEDKTVSKQSVGSDSSCTGHENKGMNSGSPIQAVFKCTNIDSGNEQNVIVKLPSTAVDSALANPKAEQVVPYDTSVVSIEYAALNGVRKKTKGTAANMADFKTKHSKRKHGGTSKGKNGGTSSDATVKNVCDKQLGPEYVCAKHKGVIKKDENFSSDDVVNEIDIMLEHKDTYKYCRFCAMGDSFADTRESSSPGMDFVDNAAIASSKAEVQVEKLQKSKFWKTQSLSENVLDGTGTQTSDHVNCVKPYESKADSNIISKGCKDGMSLFNSKQSLGFYPVPYRENSPGFIINETVPEMVQVKLEFINEQDEVTWL